MARLAYMVSTFGGLITRYSNGTKRHKTAQMCFLCRWLIGTVSGTKRHTGICTCAVCAVCAEPSKTPRNVGINRAVAVLQSALD